MKTLLLTGFVPFLDHKLNPTEEIVNELNGKTIGNYVVEGRVLSVDFNKSGNELIEHYEAVKPDVVISLGLAGGRHCITPERIAINCNDGVKDNTGRTPQDEKVVEGGPDGYFSTLPIRRFVDRLKEEQLPAKISNTAGTYLCNNVMYTMLHYSHLMDKDVRSGFIHIPASHELATLNSRLPSWSHHDLIRAMTVMIEALDE
ncbi:pyroglutamyl-peptidase I [Haloplasma contractile]|uniref:Pyroglutamyl-peptidase I n=1 Tax=Haloplasma contractile SSD-17B TaxID=1033810 RepID=U2E9Q1_9MOLU|nr:pyroglutamyl-peptidase I [Haloplasma contractile]ERJ11863.1 Pyrrolidone-carboxylate peptidase protein [Haloplasma contractile SSD-17B]